LTGHVRERGVLMAIDSTFSFSVRDNDIVVCDLLPIIDILIPGDQKGLFKLAVQLRKFYISVIYNTATGYVLLVYLTNS
jgi:hypothetical protein